MSRERDAAEPIAVIGMALRIPAATTPERFWRNILDARDCLTRPSVDELRRAGVSRKRLADPRFVRARPLLDDVEYFDAAFFGMSSFEAERTDPAHRMFLECVWEALERAAVVPGAEGPVTGVFGGVEGIYRKRNLAHLDEPALDPVVDLPLRLGTALDFFTARVSHKLDLVGPSFTVTAACATSLLAVHLAVQSLRRRECAVAVAGGASVDLPQTGGYLSGVEGMLSPTGCIRPFDAAADGTVFGNGVGVVILRPLADALAEGNPIHAVIRGSATTNDGNPADKESFIAPSPEGQRAAVAGGLAGAGIDAATIGYVEAHGTGTLLGDPTEVASLSEVYRRYTDRTGYCGLGSVKANVGHLRTAAGVLSLMKACLALEHAILPPAANFAVPNPLIDFPRTPFFVNTEPRNWARTIAPRRAGVSAFGFGGSNVHVVLEEAPRPTVGASGRCGHLLTVSARSESALERRLVDLGAHLEKHPELDPADVAHTLQSGRKAMTHRSCVYVEDAVHASRELLAGKPPVFALAAEAETRPLAVLFPGQGSQRPGMGAGLYAQEPVYRETVDRCAALLEPELGFDIRTLLRPEAGPGAQARVLQQTGNAQPALFVVEYALAQLFLSWGAAPNVMLGHSLGEVTAACVGKVFSLRDALRIVAARSRLMQRCAPGAMAAVFFPAEELAALLPHGVEVAAVNAPGITVVSGPEEAVEHFTGELGRKGIASQPLETSHAFHSRMMEPALPEFRALLREIELKPPEIPIISNASGLPLKPEQATDPEYWAAHVRHTVHFSRGLAHLLEHDSPVFLELGPGRALADLVRLHRGDARAVASLGSATGAPCADEPRNALLSLGAIWRAGAEVAWQEVYGAGKRRKVVLPTYPFQRRRHWIDAPQAEGSPMDGLALYEPGWRSAALKAAEQGEGDEPWLIFRDALGLGDAVAARLAGQGRRVVSLSPGASFGEIDAATLSVRPGSRDDLEAALAYIAAGNGAHAPRVLHLWSLTGPAAPHNSVTAFEAEAVRGFHTLLALTRAAYDHGCSDGLHVLVAADGLARLEGEKAALQAEKAALLGACRSLPREIPGLSMHCLDIPAIEAGRVPSWLTTAIIEEAHAGGQEMLIALRESTRYVQTFYAVADLPVGRPRLREGGVVLITGGMGGLGLTVAEGLFEWCRARIALTSRWEPPPRETWRHRARQDDKVGRTLARIISLEARGAEVSIVRADTADRRSLGAAVAHVRSHFGTLNGVVHAAGIAEPAPALHKELSSIERVFSSKVHGAFHLEEILSESPLDFFVHFSSIAACYPDAGQVDYSAANAVLDALAQQRAEQRGGLSCAIGWGPWQEVGMAYRWSRQSRDAQSQEQQVAHETPVRGPVEPVGHPVLKSRRRLADGSVTYGGVLSRGEHWIVDEHLFKGQPLLSGTTIVECVRAAFADHAGACAGIELNRVAFERPLFVPQCGAEIEVRFTPEGRRERFEVYSRPGGSGASWLRNASGMAASLPRARPGAGKRPPPDLARQLPPPRGEFISVGPRFRCLRAVKDDGDSTWSHLQLADAFLGDMRAYVVHPGLLDLACSMTTRRFRAEAVPYTIDAVRVHAHPGAEFFAHGQRRSIGGADAFDVEILNPEGEILVEIQGYVLREIRESSLPRFFTEGMQAVSSSAAAAPARRLVVTRPGDLGSIGKEPFTPEPPGTGEVQIEVVAAALNFRDLLSAMGQLPGEDATAARLGSECSGIVRAVGRGVNGLRSGDAVVAIAGNAFATHATADADLVLPLPPGLSFEHAAALPIVFLTAHYALDGLARLASGERILIHAASGGVGLAAVQLAQQRGAEIFATAGRPEKRDYLKALGIDHVMDSRSLAFAPEIRRLTGGEGVDVVLNSLAGEFIEASLALLRPYGRFVEIGKRDIYADSRLGLFPFRNNLSYHALDLGKMIEERRALVVELFDELMDGFSRGDLAPLPVSMVSFDQPQEAFEQMARASHIGKIVFRVRSDPARSAAARFREHYGEGISVARGLNALRHLLSSDETPPHVLAVAGSIGGAAAAGADAKTAVRGPRRLDIAAVYRAPESALEKTLVGIWEKTLGLAPIGVDDHFFELGGDSITAIQIQYSVARECNARLPATVLFNRLTVSRLAEVIRLVQETSADTEEIEALLSDIEAATEEEAGRELARLEPKEDG